MERINGRDAEAAGNWEPGIVFLSVVFLCLPMERLNGRNAEVAFKQEPD
jgi:hypothetical protein